MTAHDDDDDMLDDTEWPDESDLDETDDQAETAPCPFCGKFVYEQADVCPHCGNFISFEDGPPSAQRRIPLWVLIGLILALVVMVFGWTL